MKVRKLDEAGDMTMGRGSSCFLADTPDAIAQNVMTRLALWRGSWFLDTTEGTPWLQEILGKHEAVESVLRARILETPGVTEISKFESILNPDTRTIRISAEIVTRYGTANIEEVIG